MFDLSFVLPAVFTLGFSCLAAFYHYRQFSKKDLALSIIVFSLLIFLIVHFVSFEGSLGLGIGLLGILSIVRLRSTPENLIDIAYIFYSITVGLLAASITDFDHLFLALLLMTIVLIVFSSPIFFSKEVVKTKIVFDELIADQLKRSPSLKRRIKEDYGVDALSIDICRIDYLKDTTTIEVSYFK